MFSKKGVCPDLQQIEAFLQVNTRESPQEGKSLLGMVNYSSRFLRNFTHIMQPIHEFTQKNATWEWTARLRFHSLSYNIYIYILNIIFVTLIFYGYFDLLVFDSHADAWLRDCSMAQHSGSFTAVELTIGTGARDMPRCNACLAIEPARERNEISCPPRRARPEPRSVPTASSIA